MPAIWSSWELQCVHKFVKSICQQTFRKVANRQDNGLLPGNRWRCARAGMKMKCSSVMRIRVISLIFLNQPRISDLFIRESVAERGLQKFTWGFSKMKLFILLKLITIVAWFSNSRVL